MGEGVTRSVSSVRPQGFPREAVAYSRVPAPAAAEHQHTALALRVRNTSGPLYLLSARIGHANDPGSLPLGRGGIVRDPVEVLHDSIDLIIVTRARKEPPFGKKALAPHRIGGQLNPTGPDGCLMLANAVDLVAAGRDRMKTHPRTR
jgi:hypothetical protein